MFKWFGLGVAAALLVWAVLAFSASSHKKAQQAKQDARSATALAETAKDAAATVIARSEANADIDALVAEATKEIENAPNEKAAGDAARAAICRMPNYRERPACKLQ